MGFDPVTLRGGDLLLRVLPALGGAVTGFTAGRFPIFRETPAMPGTVSDCASFPLIPFSNRIRSGCFSFGSGEYRIPVDRRDPRFTNHGHTRHLAWEITAHTADSLSLGFAQSEPGPAWPFAFTAEQRFDLDPAGLTMRARIRNAHPGPAPAGIGFHPYFTRLADTALGFTADCVWQTDALDIPVRSATPAARFDHRITRPLGQELINHAYGGWEGRAEIIHPSRCRIEITASPMFDHLILFTPAGKDFFGFEPVSHRPDAVHPLDDARDRGMAVLAPGAWLEASVRIGVEQLG